MKNHRINLVLAGAFALLSGCNIGSAATSDVAIVAKQSQVRLVLNRSVKEWTVCDGVTDDRQGLAKAFAAAKNGAFTLVINCPVYFHVGMDITRPIFIDNGTTVKFSGAGLIIVDNVFVPAFVIANSHNIHITNWVVKYAGGQPVSQYIGGYYENGAWQAVESSFPAPPATYFITKTLNNWLKVNRNVVFEKNTNSFMTGALDPSAIFYIKGDSYNINFERLNLSSNYLMQRADKYIPIAFALVPDYVNNTTVKVQQAKPYKYDPPVTKPYIQVPHDIYFENIALDGFYHGWHGSTQNAWFNHIQAYHYSTLQDESGNNVGGIGKWFAPPHLFYLNNDDRFDPSLYNRNIYITKVYDHGIRVGKAEDVRTGGGRKNIAGGAPSLKLQVINGVVDNYRSYRPDGFLGLLASSNLRVSNVKATYDSQFLDYLFPIMSFPSIESFDSKVGYVGTYKNILFDNIELADIAPYTYIPILTGSRNEHNESIQFYNTKIKVNSWLNEEPKLFNPTEYIDAPGFVNQTYFKGTNNVFEITSKFRDEYKTLAAKGIYTKKSVKIPVGDGSAINSLQSIPVNSFGLLYYKIENHKATATKLTFPLRSTLPANIEYDYTRAKNLCFSSDTNTSVILPAFGSCELMLQYRPNPDIINEDGILLYQIAINDTINLPLLKIPYSSRMY